MELSDLVLVGVFKNILVFFNNLLYNIIMKRKAVICDLDGTLCDANHRVHYVEKQPKNWAKFFAEAFKDKVNTWCLDMMKNYQAQGIEVLFVTGRHEGLVNSTIGWIYTHTPFEAELHTNLFMRGEGDFREDTIIKQEIYDKVIAPKYEIIMAVDDKSSIIKMWESYNIPVIYCGPGSQYSPKKK